MKNLEQATEHNEQGFTLVELLVASTISSVVMAMLIGSVMANQQAYYEDVIRTRINSNLRSAMDIIAMNIRQSGEHLSEGFPAIIVENGVASLPDVLTLRRGLISEVLTLCTNVSAGSSQIYVSSALSTEPECLASNVSFPFSQWQAKRAGENIRAYIYDRVNDTGEWVDFSSDGTDSGNYWIGISPLSSGYTAIQTTLYLLEEYSFSMGASTDSLHLTTDGEVASPQPVAFSLSDFQVVVELDDGSEVDSLDETSAKTWKDIKRIRVSLSGQEQRRKRVFSSELTAGYFPRNVLSE